MGNIVKIKQLRGGGATMLKVKSIGEFCKKQGKKEALYFSKKQRFEMSLNDLSFCQCVQ